MHEIRQSWNWSDRSPNTNLTAPGVTQWGFGLGMAVTRVPAASMEDSCPLAILKFKPRNSFDYRVHYEPQLRLLGVQL